MSVLADHRCSVYDRSDDATSRAAETRGGRTRAARPAQPVRQARRRRRRGDRDDARQAGRAPDPVALRRPARDPARPGLDPGGQAPAAKTAGADRARGRGPDSLRYRDSDAARRLTVYFDTSALIKLLVGEPGGGLARDLWEEADVRTSTQLIYAEVRAAAAAIHRAGRIRTRRYPSTVEEIDALYADLDVIAIDDPLARSAGDLAERHALRGYDAVHLASALAIDLPGELVIATWDRELAAAAVAEGRMVVPAR